MKRAIILSMVLFAAACSGGDDNKACNGSSGPPSLEGSYCEEVPIDFTDAQVRRQNETGTENFFIFIRYVDGTANPTEPRKVLEIFVASENVTIEPNTDIILTSAGATVRRFPAVMEGSVQAIDLTGNLEATSKLTFTEFTGEIGSQATGQFNLLFDTGRTLSGEFSSLIVDNDPRNQE